MGTRNWCAADTSCHIQRLLEYLNRCSLDISCGVEMSRWGWGNAGLYYSVCTEYSMEMLECLSAVIINIYTLKGAMDWIPHIRV